MKDVLQQICLIFLLSLSQSLIRCDECLPPDNDHERRSDIEKCVTDVEQYGFTTLNYEDIPPMSIDVDGAPQVGPVVYGSASDLEDSQHNPTDDEVKRLREEFFKKHRQQTGQPAQNKHKDDVKNIGKHEIRHGADKEAAVKCEKVQKTLGELYNKLNVAHDLMNEDLKENNIIKQHWNAQEDIHGKHEHMHQHWNGEKINKQNNHGQEWTIFPKEPGHMNDDFQRKFHDEIYNDPNPDVDAIKKNNINLKKNHKADLKMNRNIQINLKQFQDEEKVIKDNPNNVDAIKTNEIHLKKGDKTDMRMEGNIQINLKKLEKVRHLRHQFQNILNLKEKLDSKDNLKLYRKLMDVELQQTTNPHQHDELRGPGCELKKKSNENLRNILKNNEKFMKHKRGKRNVISTIKQRRRSGSTKTTEIYWDVDGRFRDISAVERERNEFDDAEANTTQRFWIHDDGYRAKTAKKFRPRPPLRYNRYPKEPLDYGSYDKSEYWRYMTELVTGATFPKEWYDSMPTPKDPSTKEVFEMCRENFTTSECFQYPDISRLRDTKERRFMKKYYKKKYSDLETEEEAEGDEERKE